MSTSENDIPVVAEPPRGDQQGYAVEIPTMKSLFIEMCFGQTVLAKGTAFLVANNRESHCALVTNRHNVTGRHQITGECLSKTGGVPDNIVIYFHKNVDHNGEWLPIRLPLYRDDGSPYWFEHSLLGKEADVVALNLRWGSDVCKMPYYLETTLDRCDMVVGPAEPVSVIGFPFGQTSVEKFPVWATGFLAQELSLVTPAHPTFMIDCRTRQGQSGSPVIAYRVGNHRVRQGEKWASVVSPHPIWEFLGIYAGRVNPESDLGRVWHISAIADVLGVATADAARRNANRDGE
ncbi:MULTISPECIES: trypsin-like serine peptidase [unclassified Burkholderia]|uniref:trypsin-like serine peptidase n=1 Tax=unclassified Burkholderia TaxID=2613784 RepID=UPI001E33F0F9|nr:MULTISPECIES: trypsin-like peptidase domain-containing protein [unclassified Burkholderia]UEP31484.1 serine protease [Burkholderia sp. B21-007]UEP43270.1 serine protease [Burkholderia sp. B21-005]